MKIETGMPVSGCLSHHSGHSFANPFNDDADEATTETDYMLWLAFVAGDEQREREHVL